MKGREYRIKFHFSDNSQSRANLHKLKVFAANGLTESIAACGSGSSPVPIIGSIQQIGEAVTDFPVNSVTDLFFTFTATQNFSQIWFYPSAVWKSGGDAEVSYLVDIDDIEITPNMCTPDITYNTGVIPSGTVEFGRVTAGSSAGTGGSGTVTNNPNVNTTILVGYEATFLPETYLTANAGYQFVASIRPCNFRIANSSATPGTEPVLADLRTASLPTGKN
ncbi:hypothetical protein [Paraflavitalea speifideaquila]|uniref:hypothetical protein n=1 Tax=Paraflavitalea speifideaquila TaxID=3076558 RepID=UPI0028EB75E9|nr:hypothetical protein [Paraflavitalea speifideiaquila]